MRDVEVREPIIAIQPGGPEGRADGAEVAGIVDGAAERVVGLELHVVIHPLIQGERAAVVGSGTLGRESIVLEDGTVRLSDGGAWFWYVQRAHKGIDRPGRVLNEIRFEN